jgi:uncharacterized protein (DUF433 family)
MQNNIITNFSEASHNILRFVEELRQAPGLQSRLGTFKVWYAIQNTNETMNFAPSKFIGRRKNTAVAHLRESGGSGKRHGNDGKKILDQWFVDVPITSAQHRHLWNALSTLYASYGKTPNAGARFRLPGGKADIEKKHFNPSYPSDDLIVYDPEICNGKPTLKGTRIRVVDVLQLLAGGETVDSILQDYPSLQRFHIDAALAYAAIAVDHRVIRAA